MRKNTYYGVAIVSLVLVAIVTVSPPWTREKHSPGPRLERFHESTVIDTTDPRRLVGFSHDVFFARVIDQAGSGLREGMPETQFRVMVSHSIKGSLPSEVIVNQIGGIDPASGTLVLPEGDQLLIPGQEYLFATRVHPNGLWQTVVSSDAKILIRSAAERDVVRSRYEDARDEQIVDPSLQ